ncbi:MAG: hypothetical protein LBO66_01715 [Deltaproteobacteria bacterium]|nr:hypothetical protein [Deltaproteobacteria bacterium]
MFGRTDKGCFASRFESDVGVDVHNKKNFAHNHPPISSDDYIHKREEFSAMPARNRENVDLVTKKVARGPSYGERQRMLEDPPEALASGRREVHPCQPKACQEPYRTRY